MVAKKKVSKSVHADLSGPVGLEEETKKEERKVPVTQVVEVVEDSEAEMSPQTVTHSEVPAQTDAAEVSVESPSVNSEKTEYTEEPRTAGKDTSDEKRKELVDELFQKRIDKPVEVAPEISMHTAKSRKSKPIYMWAVGIITACLVLGVSLFIFSGKSGTLPSIVLIPSPTPTPSLQASPTPTPSELKRDAVTVQVLNGGGKAGAATAMKKTLEDKGYVVKNTGNADAYTYEKTEIQVKSAKAAYLPMLEADLKSSYTLGTSAATLEETASYDVRVIVGKE